MRSLYSKVGKKISDMVRRRGSRLPGKEEVREIFLHVGLHKTGSSSIQETLYLKQNNDLLRLHGIHYLRDVTANHSQAFFSMFCDRPEEYRMNIKLGIGAAEAERLNRQYAYTVSEEMKHSDCAKLVISGEDISRLPLQNLLRLREFLQSSFAHPVQFKVIIYVRDPIHWGVSATQQVIKGGFHLQYALQHAEENLAQLLKWRITNLVEAFGRQHTHVFAMEDAVRQRNGLLGHFLSVVGFPSASMDGVHILKVNESMSLTASDLISFINERLPLYAGTGLHPDRKAGDVFPLLKIRGPAFNLPADIKRRFYEIVSNDIQWLSDTYDIRYAYHENSDPSLDYRLSDEAIKDIRSVYDEVTPPLKPLLLEYIAKKSVVKKNG